MSGDIKNSVKSVLLNYALNELCKPSSYHAYNYMKMDLSSSGMEVVGALMASHEDNSAEGAPLELHTFEDDDDVNYNATQLDIVDLPTAVDDVYFRNNFRMKKSTMESLVQTIGNKVAGRSQLLRDQLPLETKVHLTVWMLGTTEPYYSVCDRFNIDKKLAYNIFYEVCNDIVDLANDYIKWPSSSRSSEIAEAFEDQYGFPGVIGVIGGCYIPIIPPSEDQNKYIDNMGNHSIVLQAVCDDKMYFTDVYAGCPGKLSLGRVLGKSPLYAKISNKDDPLIEPRKHILGDSIYPQLATLLTPYDSLNLNDQQKKFNRLHRNAHKVIEASLKKLRARFKRLKYIHLTPLDFVNKIIVSACTLHNFIIAHGDLSWNNDWEEEPSKSDIYSSPAKKRNYIAENL